MKNKRRWLLFLAGAILLCLLFAGLALVYANYSAIQAVPTRPLVNITGVVPEGSALANQAVVVFGEAKDPDGIENVELWINGQMVASQVNPAQDLHSFSTSQPWIPTGPGDYLISLRGVDRKGFSGQSEPMLIQVVERSYKPDPAVHGQYIVQKGDSLESIAKGLGTTPEEITSLNPGLGSLLVDESLEVPGRGEGESGGDVSPPAGGDGVPPADIEEPPHVPPTVPAPAGDGIPAIIAPPPWWDDLPFPDFWTCVIQPELCARPIEGDEHPLAALDVHASLEDGCQATVTWTDNSANEVGFRVYRITNRPRFRLEALALLSPSPDTGARLTYTDTLPASASLIPYIYYYMVETYNSSGQIWSALSEPITPVCPAAGGSPDERALAVEALDMTVRDSYDRLYCYFSLAGSSFERIPHGTGEFIEMDSGAWNIADFASGRNKRTIVANGSRPLNIIVECLGWQGDILVNLGRFTRSHPPEEWDGRLLTASPDEGSFSVTYRIEPTEEAFGHGGGDEGAWPLIDPRIPAPYNLRGTSEWTSCSLPPGMSIAVCSPVNEPSLAWDYTIFEGAPRPPLFFRVYKRLESESVPRAYFDTILAEKSAPLDDTGQRTFYSVSAVVGYDPVTHEEIQSPFSEELDILPLTGTLKITLVDMWPYGNDGDAYGWFSFNGHLIRWNDHCDSGLGRGCATFGPSYTVIHDVTVYRWEDMSLNQGDGWRGDNNVILIPISLGEPLRMGLQFWEHFWYDDDSVWCSLPRPGRILLEARSIDDWRRVDQEIVLGDYSTGDYIGCEVVLRVQGMP